MKFNNKKIAILSIASLLSIGVISASFALFYQVDGPIDIIINGQTGKDGIFKLEAKETLTSSIINPTTPTKFSYYLGMTPGATFTQTSTFANLSVTIDAPKLNDETKADFFSKLEITPVIGGYKTGTYYAEHTPTLSGSVGTYSGNIPIRTEAGGNEDDPKQYVEVSIAYTGTLDDYIDKYNNVEITSSITLKAAVDSNRLYIIGDFDSCGCDSLDVYSFVPNMLNTDTNEELIYENLPLVAGNQFKFYCYGWDNNGYAKHNKLGGTGSEKLDGTGDNWKATADGNYSFKFKTTGTNPGFTVDYKAA